MTEVSTITGPSAPERTRLHALFARFGPYASVVLSVLAISLIWAGALGNIAFERTKTEQAALQSAQNLARAFEEHINRSVRAADYMLIHIRDSYQKGGQIDAALWSRPFEALGGLSFQIAIIDRNGLLAASNIESDEIVDLSDRAHFRIHAVRDADELYISKPVIGRVSGRPAVQLTRRISMPDGSFGGVAVVSVDPDYFARFYQTIDLGQKGAISLVGTDGVIRARGQQGRLDAGRSNAGRLLAEFGQAKSGSYTTKGVDDIERMVTYREVRGYPLIVAVELAADEVFATHERVRLARMLAALFLTAILGPLLILIIGYQRELARARDAAEAGTRARMDFLAAMSHEIRTPMNAVLGFANTLLESKLDTGQRLAATALHGSGENLLRILNDILDFSRLDSGRVALEAIAFSPAALTQAAVGIVAQSANAKGLKLRAEIDPGLPPALEGDAGRIRQVVLNLLANAVKFTERGEILLEVRCCERTQSSATVQWSVTDTGIGIAPDRIGGAFVDFVQADSAANRRFGGSGLGLAICKRIIDQMGGRIEVRSEVDRGSRFAFGVTLPLSAAVFEPEKDAGSAARDFAARIAAFGRPLRILLAEDNPTNQLVGKQILREFDAIVDVASNGVEAVQLAREFSYDVILMDMQMPEMDGIQATRAIRAGSGAQAQVPIVALTANAYPEDVSACLAAGMNGFVAKPVRKFVLIEAILRVLPKLPGGNVPAAFPLALATAGAVIEEQAPIVDRSAVDEFIDEIGADAAESIFATFLAETERRLGTLSDLTCEDRAGIHLEAHTLIGSSGTFGMMRLAQLSRQLERQSATIAPDDYRGAVERLREVYRVSRQELLDYLGEAAKTRAVTEN